MNTSRNNFDEEEIAACRRLSDLRWIVLYILSSDAVRCKSRDHTFLSVLLNMTSRDFNWRQDSFQVAEPGRDKQKLCNRLVLVN